MPKGSRNLNVIAAIIAQKKLLEWSDIRGLVISVTNLLHMTLGGKKYDTSSKLNKTPPMGAPKATATPAAQAALRISRLLPVNKRSDPQDDKRRSRKDEPSFVSYLLKKRLTMFPMQLAMWTNGPSLPRRVSQPLAPLHTKHRGIPSDNPEATESARPTDLVNRVRPPR